MPLPIIPNTYRCAITWSGPSVGAPAVNVLHVGSDVEETGAAVIEAINSNTPNDLFNFVSDAATTVTIVVTPLDGTSASTSGSLPFWNGNGSGEISPQLSAVLRLNTDLRGPSFRGRMFLPYLPEGVMDSGTTDEATRATTEAAWSTYQDNMIADGFVFVVASYKLEQVTPVTSWSVAAPVGRVKRRLGL